MEDLLLRVMVATTVLREEYKDVVEAVDLKVNQLKVYGTAEGLSLSPYPKKKGL